MKNLQQKTRSLPRVQSNTKARELPNPPNGQEEKSTEKRKGSTVTSRVREREAETAPWGCDVSEYVSGHADRYVWADLGGVRAVL